MVECKCNKNNSMNNREAYLRAQLLLKSAQLDDSNRRYQKLSKEYDKLLEQFKIAKHELQEKDIDLVFYAGMISGYSDCVDDIFSQVGD